MKAEPTQLYTDRSRLEDTHRCRRLRYLGYHAGDESRGVQPKKKSIHLVLGGAVHAGLASLLDFSQQALWSGKSLDQIQTWGRPLEDTAVGVALTELVEMTMYGVELDSVEKAETQALLSGGSSDGDGDTNLLSSGGEPQAGTQQANKDSDGLLAQDLNIIFQAASSAGQIAAQVATTIYPNSDTNSADEFVIENDPIKVQTGFDAYLRDELGALVEGIVRCYSRRGLKPLLEQYEILEVEREGEWKLAEFPNSCEDEGCPHFGSSHSHVNDTSEINFMSRHDGLLRDRVTNQLHLLSFKTTGSWDIRKAEDAKVDQQGLSEAVDVEKRLREAWRLIHAQDKPDNPEFGQQIAELVNLKTAAWLITLSEPPTILGVHYQYILKGARRKDKNDPDLPGRYVADSPLVRAYKQDGITLEDTRWAFTYDWQDATGKGRRLDYRSWKKAPIWKHIPIANWIDMLDSGEVQPDALNEDGCPIDILADQLIAPIVVYRNEDDMRDWLEQTAELEIQIQRSIQIVHEAHREGPAAFRSALNTHFPQNRRACSWPSKCAMWEICFGNPDLRYNPEASDLYQTRLPNHPQELP